MSGGVFQDWVTDTVTGAVIPGASVTVRLESSGALANIYSDTALSAPLTNPVIADVNGFVRFYAARGAYRIEAVSGVLQATLRDVALGAASQRDVGVTLGDQLIDRDSGDARYISDAELTVRLGTAGNLGEAATYDVNPSAGNLVEYNDIIAMADAVVTSRLGTTGALGSMAVQDSDNVAITGGTINGIDALIIDGAGGLGYGTGAGGAVVQVTSKSTGVTLNKACGQITMHNTSLAAATAVGFTLTNSAIATTDVIVVSIDSGATVDAYHAQADAVGAGSCRISLRNMTAGALGESVVLNFAVIKAVAA